MWVKGSRTRWISMSHNWGASYQAFATLSGQALSFRITSYTTKETTIAWNVAPPNWAAGLTYSTDRCQFPLKASTKIFIFPLKALHINLPPWGSYTFFICLFKLHPRLFFLLWRIFHGSLILEHTAIWTVRVFLLNFFFFDKLFWMFFYKH